MFLFVLSFGFTFLALSFVVGRYDDIYLIRPHPIKYYVFRKHVGFRIVFKLVRKTKFEQTYNFV